MVVAVVKDGKIIAQGSPGLSHAQLVARQLGGIVPEGAEVVSIGKFEGQILAQRSVSYYGNSLPASDAAQAAAKGAFY